MYACEKSLQWLYIPCFIYHNLASLMPNPAIQYIQPLTCRLAYTRHTRTAAINVTDWSEPASCVAECFGSLAVRLNCGGVGAGSPDVIQVVRPLRLIRLIRGSNLASWHWTLPFMRPSSENSQDGWVLHSPEQLRPACSSSALTCERLGPDYGIVSVLNQICRPSHIGHSQTGPKHIFILFFDAIVK